MRAGGDDGRPLLAPPQPTPPPPLQDAGIVDLGGGTGNFTQALADASGARRRVLCVDAFAEMLQKVQGWPLRAALAAAQGSPCCRRCLTNHAPRRPSTLCPCVTGPGAPQRGADVAGRPGLCAAAACGDALQPCAAQGTCASPAARRHPRYVRWAVPPAGARRRGAHHHAAAGGGLPTV